MRLENGEGARGYEGGGAKIKIMDLLTSKRETKISTIKTYILQEKYVTESKLYYY